MKLQDEINELYKKNNIKITTRNERTNPNNYHAIYKGSRRSSKPILFDPNAKDGPVKVFSREEILEYEKSLKGE